MKKLLMILITLSVLLCALPSMAESGTAETGGSAVETGDIVTFGRYEQDGDDTNGPEPVEWIVLDIEDGNALLISRYEIDVKPYHDIIRIVTWEECLLRAWLNGDFLTSAFSEAEQADIVETMLDNPDNPVFSTEGGNATEDRVFLLSIEEAERYFNYDEDRAASRTAYAAALGDSKERWWLRSPGSFRTAGACVREDGVILDGGEVGPTAGIGVRPALWLRGGSMEATVSSKGSGKASADAYSHAGPGEPVYLSAIDTALELQLYTASFDNRDLMSASTGAPSPAQGELYLLRFGIPEEGEARTYDEILAEIVPALQLRARSDGDPAEVFQVITPDDEATRVFDLVFYCAHYHELSDMELLCDGVLYSLDDLPRTGEKLALPTAEELAALELNELHKRAKHENGDPIDEAACTGGVIVACYTFSDDDATPEVLTTDSEDDWAFPREYRAESFETARWAALIYPTHLQVGWYSGIAGGAANETTTWLALVDLETDKLYEVKVATEDPPKTITVQTINGIPQHSGANGEFRDKEAMDRLISLVEAANK